VNCEPGQQRTFGGAVPIDYTIHAGVMGMLEVRKMLDAWVVGLRWEVTQCRGDGCAVANDYNLEHETETSRQ